jgi:hypothetical protein
MPLSWNGPFARRPTPGTLFRAGSARLLTVVTAVGDMLALFRADLVEDVMALFRASLVDLSPTFLRQMTRDIAEKRSQGPVQLAQTRLFQKVPGPQSGVGSAPLHRQREPSLPRQDERDYRFYFCRRRLTKF